MTAKLSHRQVPEPFVSSQPAALDSGDPPLLHSWTRLYAVVIGELVFIVLLFIAFSRYFR